MLLKEVYNKFHVSAKLLRSRCFIGHPYQLCHPFHISSVIGVIVDICHEWQIECLTGLASHIMVVDHGDWWIQIVLKIKRSTNRKSYRTLGITVLFELILVPSGQTWHISFIKGEGEWYQGKVLQFLGVKNYFVGSKRQSQ